MSSGLLERLHGGLYLPVNAHLDLVALSFWSLKEVSLNLPPPPEIPLVADNIPNEEAFDNIPWIQV